MSRIHFEVNDPYQGCVKLLMVILDDAVSIVRSGKPRSDYRDTEGATSRAAAVRFLQSSDARTIAELLGIEHEFDKYLMTSGLVKPLLGDSPVKFTGLQEGYR